jgi:hypothetical protein
MGRLLPKFVSLAAALFVSACVTPPPDVPPLLEITSENCAAVPDFSAAVPTVVTLDGDDEKPATVTLDAASRCLAGTTGKSLYAIFSIPDGGPYTISLSSVLLGSSILAPKAEVLDAQGAMVHELPASSFLFRGSNLTSLYRSHAGEHYLLVESDPANVGKPLQRVKENVQVTTASAGYVYFEIHTGTDVANTATWSHNGQISVSVVRDKPAKK